MAAVWRKCFLDQHMCGPGNMDQFPYSSLTSSPGGLTIQGEAPGPKFWNLMNRDDLQNLCTFLKCTVQIYGPKLCCNRCRTRSSSSKVSFSFKISRIYIIS